MDNLRRPHASIPRSPRIAEPLFLARYIEKAGTGTLDMTLTDKPTNSQQKYRLTAQGAAKKTGKKKMIEAMRRELAA